MKTVKEGQKIEVKRDSTVEIVSIGRGRASIRIIPKDKDEAVKVPIRPLQEHPIAV